MAVKPPDTTKIVSVVIETFEPPRMIRADYFGGSYIELSFGTDQCVPTEVINVWDYARDEPDISFNPHAVNARVVCWMGDQEHEWPEWYEAYLENARH